MYEKNISSHKNVVLISSVLEKIIPDATTPTVQEVSGLLNPSYFVEGIRFSCGIAITITKLIDFHSHVEDVLIILFATVFN